MDAEGAFGELRRCLPRPRPARTATGRPIEPTNAPAPRRPSRPVNSGTVRKGGLQQINDERPAMTPRRQRSALPWGWVGLGLCGVAVLLSATGVPAGGLILALVVLGWSLPIEISLPGRLALAIPIWAGLNITVLPALQAVGVRPGPVVPAAAYAVVSVLVVPRTRRARAQCAVDLRVREWRVDLASLLPGIAVAGALLTTWVSRTLDDAMTFFMGAPDNATHLYLLRLVATQRGVLYWANTNSTGGASNLFPYPQGFHLNAAVAGQAIFGTLTNDPTRLFQSFALGSFTSCTLLVALSGLCAAALARRIGARTLPQAIAGIAAAVALALGPLGLLLYLGFQAQIMGYALLFALLMVSLSPLPTTRTAAAARLTLVGVLIVGLANSYYVILPVAVPLLVVELIRLREEWPSWRLVGPIGLVLGTAALVPIAAGIEGGSLSHFGDTGLVTPLSRPALIALGLVAVSGLVVPAIRRAARAGALTFVLTVVAALGLELALLIYQNETLGGTRYYYEKSVYTTFMLLLVATAAVGALILDRAVRSLHEAQWVSMLLLVGVAAVTVGTATGALTAFDTRPVVSWIDGRGRLSASPTVLDSAFALRPPPRDGTSILVWDPGDHSLAATRFFETRWLNAMLGRLDLKSNAFEVTWFTRGQHDAALARFVAHNRRRTLLIVPHGRMGVCTTARTALPPAARALLTCWPQSGG